MVLPNETLRAAREAAHLTQQGFADALVRAGREQGIDLHCSARHVAKWESGEVSWPQPRYRRALEAATGMPCAELGFSGSAHRSRGSDSEQEETVRRRDFLAAASTTLVSAAMGAVGAFRFGPHDGPRVTSGYLDAVNATLSQITDLERKFGAEKLLPLMDAQIQELAQLLTTRPGDSAAVRSTAGAAYLQAGWMYFDAGHQSRARAHYKEALFLAQLANDRPLVAMTTSVMSTQSCNNGNPDEGIQLARLGSENTHHPGRLSAMLAVREARGWAQQGNRDEAYKSIRRARDVFALSADDPAWASFFTEGEIDGAEAEDVFGELGDWDRAEPVAQAAAADTALPVRAQVSTKLFLAKVLIRRGDVSGAQEVIAGVSPTLPFLASARTRARISDILGALPNIARKQDVWRHLEALV